MKTFILLVFVLSCFGTASSQQQISTRSAKTLYGEISAVSRFPSFTINFEARLKGERGLGIHGGTGLVATNIYSGGTILIFPVGVNFLAGKNPNYLELSAGATFIAGSSNTYGGGFGTDKVPGIVFVPGAGYRYQDAGKGVSFRIFASPWIGVRIVSVFGASIGYTF